MRILIPLILALSTLTLWADSCCTSSPAAVSNDVVALPDLSIFHLEGSWTRQDEQPVTLKAFAGKPTLVTMFFASCSYACPMLIEDLRGLLAQLTPEERSGLQLALLSFDSERDNPEALRAFAEQRALATPPWSLLHGDRDVVQETAAVLGVRYRKDPQGNFAHSNIISLINRQGEVAYQLNGLRADPAPLLKAIRSELHKK